MHLKQIYPLHGVKRLSNGRCKEVQEERNKRLSNYEMKIDNIYWERIQLYIEGHIEGLIRKTLY